jgi:Cu+-exporting ATPase
MKQTFNVEGMTCAACSSAVERIVRKQAGIEKASVNLATKKLAIEFNEDLLNIDLMKEKVAKAGFEVLDEVTEKTIIMPIAGMT